MLGRTGSEGVRGMFREQSWKCCLRASLCRCKPNFRGSGVYVPRSVDWHPALWCMISLIMRNNDGNQVAPLTREHPRRRYTPVDYPWPLRMPASASRASSLSGVPAAPPAVTRLPHAPSFRRPPLSRRGEALWERAEAGSGLLGAASSESAAGSGRLRACGC